MKLIYDYTELKNKMEEYRFSQRLLAKEVGISTTSLNLKLNSKSEFLQSEILSIAKILDIPNANLSTYFFNVVVRKNVQKQRV